MKWAQDGERFIVESPSAGTELKLKITRQVQPHTDLNESLFFGEEKVRKHLTPPLDAAIDKILSTQMKRKAEVGSKEQQAWAQEEAIHEAEYRQALSTARRDVSLARVGVNPKIKITWPSGY